MPDDETSPLGAPAGETLPLSIEQRSSVRPHKLRRWWYTFNVDLPGSLDVAALDCAVTAVIRRHDPLRLRLIGAADSYRQKFTAPPETALVVDEYDEDRLSIHWDRMDVLQSGPFAATLVRSGRWANRLLVSVHHVAWDAWSYYILGNELQAAYDAAVAGTEPDWPAISFGYGDYIRSQIAAGDRLAGQQKAFWVRMFDGVAGAGDMPFTGAEASGGTVSGDDKRWGRVNAGQFAAASAGKVRAVAAAGRVTTSTVMLAAVLISLGEAYGADDVLFHLVHHGRTTRELQRLIGNFNRSIPVRVRLDRAETFGALLTRLSYLVDDAIKYSAAPFSAERLVDEVGLPVTTGSGRLTDLVISLQFSRRPSGPMVPSTPLPVAPGESRFAAESEPEPEPVQLVGLRTRAWAPRPRQLWIEARAEPTCRCTVDFDRESFADAPVELYLGTLRSLIEAISSSSLRRPVRQLLPSAAPAPI